MNAEKQKVLDTARQLAKAAEEFRVAVEELEASGSGMDTPRRELPFDRPTGEALEALTDGLQHISFWDGESWSDSYALSISQAWNKVRS